MPNRTWRAICTAVAGEEDRRTLDMLLANPVIRGRVLLEKLAAMTAGIVLLVGVTGAALLIESPVADMRLPVGPIIAAMFHLALLAVVFGTLAGLSGRRREPHGGPRGARGCCVVAYIVNGLGPQVSWLEPFQKFSPFYQYVGHDPLVNGLSVPEVLVAVGRIAVLAVIGVAGFRRRDVAA